ncbi:MAG: helix-turn-helix transcriptional regulator [Candidatus Pseudobacter hemicellulosilyticus]|uniref:Helix-turn-helix transcriptional regulator n=1 Tax=Candidatus Pseudobacter hemicellulosilyticus TaxID=3121375 RepID=A0AAJ5WRB0_9BACT|nr:MAG: helix-turn-helix transcriptional regulator [Pseudobacter sp.]
MKKKTTLKTYSLETLTEQYVGKQGTPKRDAFEYELKLEMMGQAIKQARMERNLTQEELGQLVGVQKAQISRLENNFTNARLDTILKVFDALNARVNFRIELLNTRIRVS